ncbi:hypothetical protein [Nonomuraea bangladeshensis]|uniref:hypothetical protein n=1 Tax=Nonomuraea bangladeshensis TaxID=404385 RepID=UPI003C2AE424
MTGFLELADTTTRLRVDAVTGAVHALHHLADPHGMNWVTGPDDTFHPGAHDWGLGYLGTPLRMVTRLRRWQRATDVTAANGTITSSYDVDGVRVTVERSLRDGLVHEDYAVTNRLAEPVELGRLTVYTPLRTDLLLGARGLDLRCHAHVHAAGESSWICGIRMSGRGPHLGLAVTRGSLAGYVLDGAGELTGSAVRGDIGLALLDIQQDDDLPGARPVVLAPGESLGFGWTLFWHDGWQDFETRRHLLAPRPQIRLDELVVTLGEPLQATVTGVDHLLVRLPGEDRRWSPVPVADGRLSLTTDQPGLVELATGDPRAPGTIVTAAALPALPDLVRARTRFILRHQQVDDPGDRLDGALLPYDNRAGGIVRSHRPDLNDGRERLGMGVLLALAAPHDPDLRGGLDRYTRFVEAHLQAADGTVYDSATVQSADRLYNYPWMARFWLELYALDGAEEHLKNAQRVIGAFYDRGGAGFYPIGLPVLRTAEVLHARRRPDAAADLLTLYARHGDAIAARGLDYPTSEVPYEQAIVAPAAAILLELAVATGERGYADAARGHLDLLRAFDGRQPDARTNNVPIRHWDGYWFGLDRIWGDTMPHHWAAQSAWAYALAGLVHRDPAYRAAAGRTLRATLLTFEPDGTASCAYANALSVSGVRGRRFDPLANDQDWALVTALDIERLRSHKD